MADALPIPLMDADAFKKARSQAVKALKAEADSLVISLSKAADRGDKKMLEVSISCKVEGKKMPVKSGLMEQQLMLGRIFPIYAEAGREDEMARYLEKGFRLKMEARRPAALALERLALYPVPTGDGIADAKNTIRWDEIKERLLKGLSEDSLKVSFTRRRQMSKASPPRQTPKQSPLLKMR